MNGYQYQVIVIGSGSAGQEACLKAAKAGLDVRSWSKSELWAATAFTEAAMRSEPCGHVQTILRQRRKRQRSAQISSDRDELDQLAERATPEQWSAVY